MRRRNKQLKQLSSKHVLTSDKRKDLENELQHIEPCLKALYVREKAYEENKAIQAIQKKHEYFYSCAKQNMRIKREIGLLDNHDGKVTGDLSQLQPYYKTSTKKFFSVPMPHKVIASLREFFSSDKDQVMTISDILWRRGSDRGHK